MEGLVSHIIQTRNNAIILKYTYFFRDTFFLGGSNRKGKNKQEKADGGIFIKETDTPFLIIEAKKPDVMEKENERDLKKIAGKERYTTFLYLLFILLVS